MVYAGCDDFKVVLLGRVLMAEADSGPFMTRGDPPRVIYGDPIAPLTRQTRRVLAGARPLCSIPWQGDFPRGNVPTGKDALRSIRWKLDDRPISMKLYEFAAIDGPEETCAPEMHQRIIAMTTEQSPRIPA